MIEEEHRKAIEARDATNLMRRKVEQNLDKLQEEHHVSQLTYATLMATLEATLVNRDTTLTYEKKMNKELSIGLH